MQLRVKPVPTTMRRDFECFTCMRHLQSALLLAQ